MAHDLTKEECRLLERMLSAAKWSFLIYDLVYIVPVTILIVLSALHGSMRGVFVGITTYVILRLWMTSAQCRMMPVLQAAVKKLMAASGVQLQSAPKAVPEN